MPGNFVGGIADLERLPRWDRSFVGLIAVCVAGSAAGAGLLLVTPEHAFTVVVPLLIGLATILFAGAGRIRRWILSRAARPNGTRVSPDGPRLLLFAPVAVYGGYFGAAMSVMLLAILSVSDTDDFRATDVIKNLISGLTSLVAVVVFVFQGMVAWPPTMVMVMMGGALVGGFLGGRLARVLPPNLIRGIVITLGTILTVIYAWRYWHYPRAAWRVGSMRRPMSAGTRRPLHGLDLPVTRPFNCGDTITISASGLVNRNGCLRGREREAGV